VRFRRLSKTNRLRVRAIREKSGTRAAITAAKKIVKLEQLRGAAPRHACRERRICYMHGGDFATDGEWIVACPESGESHELRIPRHPFSPAQGVTCEKGHPVRMAGGQKARHRSLAADAPPVRRPGTGR
jgi:hypothetical protein